MIERSRTYIARRRPIQMRAEPVQEQKTIDTLEGPRTAYPGDYVMIGIEGEKWPVPKDKFPELYEVLGPSGKGNTLVVQKKQFDLPVFQTYMPLDFLIRNENFHAEPGYFLVCYGKDDVYPCDPDIFFETFEIMRMAGDDEQFDLEILPTPVNELNARPLPAKDEVEPDQ